MNMKEIKTKARQLGVRPGKLKKAELIREIQKAEANPSCYNTNFSATCGQKNCLWLSDCH